MDLQNFSLPHFDSNKAFCLHPQDQATETTEDEQTDMIKSFNCTYEHCDKVFRYKSEIVRHMVTHTNQKPHVCPYKDCQKAFKRSDGLATHVRIHTGDKPYSCPMASCSQCFPTKAGLRYHVLKHKNDKVFKCEFPGCDQSFLTLSQLKQHKRGIKVHDVLLSPRILETEVSPANNQNRNSDEISSSYYRQSEYEPAVQKRNCFEMPQTSLCSQQFQHQIPGFGSNSTKYSEKIGAEPTQSNLLSLTNINLLKNSLQSESFPSILELNPANLYKSATASLVTVPEDANDQTTLFKSINKILGENSSLKKNLEMYQKMIGAYQNSTGNSKPSFF